MRYFAIKSIPREHTWDNLAIEVGTELFESDEEQMVLCDKQGNWVCDIDSKTASEYLEMIE